MLALRTLNRLSIHCEQLCATAQDEVLDTGFR